VSLRSFLDAIDERVLVCDGAMGTLLYAQGVFINRCFDGPTLTQPAPAAGGVLIGTADRQFSSILGVHEARG
jgi:hypothetical protein